MTQQRLYLKDTVQLESNQEGKSGSQRDAPTTMLHSGDGAVRVLGLQQN